MTVATLFGTCFVGVCSELLHLISLEGMIINVPKEMRKWLPALAEMMVPQKDEAFEYAKTGWLRKNVPAKPNRYGWSNQAHLVYAICYLVQKGIISFDAATAPDIDNKSEFAGFDKFRPLFKLNENTFHYHELVKFLFVESWQDDTSHDFANVQDALATLTKEKFYNDFGHFFNDGSLELGKPILRKQRPGEKAAKVTRTQEISKPKTKKPIAARKKRKTTNRVANRNSAATGKRKRRVSEEKSSEEEENEEKEDEDEDEDEEKEKEKEDEDEVEEDGISQRNHTKNNEDVDEENELVEFSVRMFADNQRPEEFDETLQVYKPRRRLPKLNLSRARTLDSEPTERDVLCDNRTQGKGRDDEEEEEGDDGDPKQDEHANEDQKGNDSIEHDDDDDEREDDDDDDDDEREDEDDEWEDEEEERPGAQDVEDPLQDGQNDAITNEIFKAAKADIGTLLRHGDFPSEEFIFNDDDDFSRDNNNDYDEGNNIHCDASVALGAQVLHRLQGGSDTLQPLREATPFTLPTLEAVHLDLPPPSIDQFQLNLTLLWESPSEKISLNSFAESIINDCIKYKLNQATLHYVVHNELGGLELLSKVTGISNQCRIEITSNVSNAVDFTGGIRLFGAEIPDPHAPESLENYLMRTIVVAPNHESPQATTVTERSIPFWNMEDVPEPTDFLAILHNVVHELKCSCLFHLFVYYFFAASGRNTIDTTIFKKLNGERMEELEFLLHTVAWQLKHPIDCEITGVARTDTDVHDYILQSLFCLRDMQHKPSIEGLNSSITDAGASIYQNRPRISEILIQPNLKQVIVDLFFDQNGRLRRDLKYAIDFSQWHIADGFCWSVSSPRTHIIGKDSFTLYRRFESALTESKILFPNSEYIYDISLQIGRNEYQLGEENVAGFQGTLHTQSTHGVIEVGNKSIRLKVSRDVMANISDEL